MLVGVGDLVGRFGSLLCDRVMQKLGVVGLMLGSLLGVGPLCCAIYYICCVESPAVPLPRVKFSIAVSTLCATIGPSMPGGLPPEVLKIVADFLRVNNSSRPPPAGRSPPPVGFAGFDV